MARKRKRNVIENTPDLSLCESLYPTPREQARSKVHELRPINKMTDVAAAAAAAADALLRSILPAEPSRVSEFKVHLFSNMRMLL